MSASLGGPAKEQGFSETVSEERPLPDPPLLGSLDPARILQEVPLPEILGSMEMRRVPTLLPLPCVSSL